MHQNIHQTTKYQLNFYDYRSAFSSSNPSIQFGLSVCRVCMCYLEIMIIEVLKLLIPVATCLESEHVIASVAR